MDDFKMKKFLIVGTGKSGVAAAELLKKKDIKATLFNSNKNMDIEDFYRNHPYLKGTAIITGDLSEEQMRETDILVLSPGVPTDLAMVKQIREMGIPIWGEIELAYRFGSGDILAITGTNGKTTTTALLGEIMESYFSDVKVVGNIGIPYTSVAADTTKDTVVVAEISSFQLETIDEFAPKVTAILNVSPDHLDRHHTMENYIAAKESITKNQDVRDICILNYEDDVLREFGRHLSIRVIFFSSKRELQDGFYLKEDTLYMEETGTKTVICRVDELNVLGKHNYENVMAAVAMAYGYGVPLEHIREVIKHFQAVEHRIEFVTEKKGIRFYNDSKGTNPDAAIQGIRAMNRPTWLIGGGYDKDSVYDEWIESFDGKVRRLVLLGQTKDKIADTAKAHGFTDIALTDSLEEAVNICYQNATEGEAILLSPACASWGMFTDYEERGRIFKEIVHKLKE